LSATGTNTGAGGAIGDGFHPAAASSVAVSSADGADAAPAASGAIETGVETGSDPLGVESATGASGDFEETGRATAACDRSTFAGSTGDAIEGVAGAGSCTCASRGAITAASRDGVSFIAPVGTGSVRIG
jgi:hypothetical protein